MKEKFPFDKPPKNDKEQRAKKKAFENKKDSGGSLNKVWGRGLNQLNPTGKSKYSKKKK